MGKYDYQAIEKKWQERWEKDKAFTAPQEPGDKKLYVLDMFPYPSGEGLHVGHVEGYTATDIYSRFKRMQGYKVLHPMGWDSFGLPAENYAIKTGIHPKETTEQAITNFRRQIKAVGLSYDWSREVGAHTPEYYKWTQWLFTKFFEKGLVYKKKALVNWDPIDQTVLANEQVLPDGTAERSGATVEKKELEQWFFKITDYAEELIEGLDTVDWPESTKINQRNWIGPSEGAEIYFELNFKKNPTDNARRDPEGNPARIPVFTTRPDTLFGATYLVLSPEHLWVTLATDDNHDVLTNKAEVKAYVEAAKRKGEIERAENKEKTGVEIRGVKAINPATKEEIPVFVADYVLAGYGTGAIMGVPAHDERDYQFAKKLNLPIRKVVDAAEGESAEIYTGEGVVVNSNEFNGIKTEEAKKKITEAVGGEWKRVYRLRDWLISRQRYWGAPIPIVYDPAGKPHAIPQEHLPWLLPTDVEFKPTGTSPLGQSKELLTRTEKIFGQGWKPEIDTMDTFVCSSWYFLRFADAGNAEEFAGKEAIKKWLPVDLYVGGAEHTVLHLLYARFFTKALRDMGYLNFSEPFLKLRHQGLILAEDNRKMSKRWGNVINPDDVIGQFGADALRLYEMFMGPLEAMKPWNTENIAGVKRFLERVWRLEILPGVAAVAMDSTIKKVTEDIETMKFNTAVSALMITLNAFEDAKGASRPAYEQFLQLLHPLAPHITAELAELHEVDLTAWPCYDEAKLKRATVSVAVQVNGKTRATLQLPAEVGEEEALSAARKDPAVAKWLAAGREKKAIYVPQKIVSFVTEGL